MTLFSYTLPVKERFSATRPLLSAIAVFLFAIFSGVSTASDDIGGNFTLTSHEAKRFELSNLNGKVVLMYFGFTSCPDVCPMELSNIGRALSSLPAESVAGLFITIDPQRDTIDKLAAYVTSFHPGIIGLTGTTEEIQSVTEKYNINYRRIELSSGYTMDHSSHIIVLDAEGRVQALAPFGSPAEHLVKLVRSIR